MPRAKAILPGHAIIQPAKLARALQNTLTNTAKDIQVDFKVTTQTWQHAVDFPIDSPDPYTRTVSTDDEVYGYVNDGTRPHHIAPHGRVLRFQSGFRSKTLPRSIQSGPGGKSGDVVFARGVDHPGTAPRAFDTAIAQKWDKLVAKIFQRAIDAEFS